MIQRESGSGAMGHHGTSLLGVEINQITGLGIRIVQACGNMEPGVIQTVLISQDLFAKSKIDCRVNKLGLSCAKLS